MLLQLAKLERRYLEIESLLSRPDALSNASDFRRLSKERSDIEEVVLLFRELRRVQEEIVGTKQLLDESSGELAEMANEELKSLRGQEADFSEKLKIALLPKDIYDGRNIYLELRAGVGGDEASLFVAALCRAYLRFCERRRWRTEIVSQNETELGGMKEVIILVEGVEAYRQLKYESGVHRVQRVPATEAQGRIHTSTVTVAVLPEADDVEVNVNENDLRVDTYRASGAGGQHVNRTDSAVRLTHLPSGIVVCCQDERSQIKNRSRALKILQTKLLEVAQEEKDKTLADERRLQVGKGDRSERIRTYNFPQSRVTDHRINHTTHAIQSVMEGNFDEFVDLLQKYYQAQLMANQNLDENHSR